MLERISVLASQRPTLPAVLLHRAVFVPTTVSHTGSHARKHMSAATECVHSMCTHSHTCTELRCIGTQLTEWNGLSPSLQWFLADVLEPQSTDNEVNDGTQAHTHKHNSSTKMMRLEIYRHQAEDTLHTTVIKWHAVSNWVETQCHQKT